MMPTKLILVIAAAAALFSPYFAQAKTRVFLGGVVPVTQYDYAGSGGSAATKGGIGYGGILLLDFFPAKDRFSFETGVGYLSRSFTDTAPSGTTTSRSVGSILVPFTGFVGWGANSRFSIGAGGFYNKVLDLDGYAGVQGQLRFTWGSKATKYFIGAQYLNGLQEDNVGVAHKDILVQLGLRFGGK